MTFYPKDDIVDSITHTVVSSEVTHKYHAHSSILYIG